ncbi:prephenate dehydratase [Rubrobacter indicoceani]|uniref:prephenate dehydratase n=1 Tax=Rubrobacter indicoceani TaxID=2051957 RepID=UPI001F097160|nr:prephenate dehydratase [Rubrobacter indicoceani]
MSQDPRKTSDVQEEPDMDHFRAGIDEVDSEIVRLLDRRARLARGIGEIKKSKGLDTYVPSRERKVLDRVREISKGDFPKGGLESVFREIISSSISLEERMKVAYLGPETTFTHEAAMRAFGNSLELVPQATVADVFALVERGEASQGVVPVENSMEGAVTHTLDELTTSPLKICGEVYLPVSQNLLSGERTIEDVRMVCSHPMALAQTTVWLRRELPAVEIQEVTSTAEAARRAAVEPGVAAVGSVLAADAHGLSILARNIQEARTNTTRFIVIGRKWAGRTGRDKTSIVLDPSLRDRPGMLRDTLAILADEGINMIRIESRPNRGRAWTYIFFIDVQGHPEDDNVRRALETLEEKCHHLAVIGAYPETSPVPVD